jgi:toxin CptA
MHSAPAVSFPVGRSRFQGWCLALIWLAGTAACVFWSITTRVNGSPADWRSYLALFVVVGTGAVALRAWQQTPRGVLRWDGQLWWLEPAVPSAVAPVTGALAVHLDFQFVMLLSLRTGQGGLHWLWLDQQGATSTSRWSALRRAAHANVRPAPPKEATA